MFRRKTPEKISGIVPNKPVKYPKWTFAQVGDSYWLILDATKMQFISERAFRSWGKSPVVASEISISGYSQWKQIGFSPGTLVRSVAGQSYFITGSNPLAPERRSVETPDFYAVLGFDPYNVIIVSTEEINFHQEGESISGI